jgi:hypothetical protein
MLPGKVESKYDYNKDEAQLCIGTSIMAKVRIIRFSSFDNISRRHTS